MTENVLTILAILGGIATAAATIITSVKKVGEGNYMTVKRRLFSVEKNQRRQNIIIGFLTDWQLSARELIRLQSNRLVDLGVPLTPQMLALQEVLQRDLTMEELLADDEPEPQREGRGRHRGQG